MSTFKINFITPLFSRGAYEDRPEIRAASIRGHLHWWFRALGGNYSQENAIFGCVHKGATASKLVVRVGNLKGQTGQAAALPHKTGGRASLKACYLPGASFELHVFPRLSGLDRDQEARFQKTLEAWLLLGTLGLRSTRAGGCFIWEPVQDTSLRYPVNWNEYEQRCATILRGSPLRFALLADHYQNPEAARCVISNTLGGPDQREDLDDLRKLHWPLGDVSSKKQRKLDDTRQERKTSPLRLRLVMVANEYRIAAIWDGRTEVTGNKPKDLEGLVRLLVDRKPALGNQLARTTLSE